MDSVVATDGKVLYVDSMATVVNNNGDGTINYMEVTEGAITYRQTFTYAAGILTGVSRWVKQ